MTDDEQSLLGLGNELREMLEDIISNQRLTEADIPDDFKALCLKIYEHRELALKVEAFNRSEGAL